MEQDMLKMHLAAGLAATALMTAAAVAQTSTAPAPAPGTTTSTTTTTTMPSTGSGQFMTNMANLMRGSKLTGTDVYGADNQKIGDIEEVLIDRDGKVHAVVVGVGGFLGIGEKNVAIPYAQLQWMEEPARTTAANPNAPATTGGVTSPTAPATTGSTSTTTGTTTAGTRADDDGVPDRAMVRMTKADLQNAPEFRYSMTDAGRTTAPAGNTSPPPAARPGTAPQQ
jgi:sporulation protein YlmC with PRC-barrel domain